MAKPAVFVVGGKPFDRIAIEGIPEFVWVAMPEVDWTASIDEIYERHFKPALYAMKMKQEQTQ